MFGFVWKAQIMKLSVLLAAVRPLSVSVHGDPEITGLSLDSRKVKAGNLFFALRGQHQNGIAFIQDALDRGAAAVVTEQADGIVKGRAALVIAADARAAMADLACAFHGYPGNSLRMIGITGTNGKTTTAFMVRDLMADADYRPGLIGTVEYEIGGRVIPAARTTPESIELQDMLAQMTRAGCKSAVLEVSSHALVQQRVRGIDFDVAVFSNLTHDHLDYHETEQKYFEAKRLLFQALKRDRKKPFAVINLDDPHGRIMAEAGGLDAELITYGIGGSAVVRAENLNLTAGGSQFDVLGPWGRAEMSLKLPGRYNVSNALAAFAVATSCGIAPDRVARVLSQMICVPGRLEEIPNAQGFQVFVDYAHTEDALRNVLSTLREITAGRLLVVFGCGGNRDAAKRPRMGAVANELADYVIITSDNPRKEDPLAIITQIRAGCRMSEKAEVVEDRYEAIVRALSLAQAGDVVLIAGKGHENYQEFANTIIPFDDRQVVRDCLRIKHADA